MELKTLSIRPSLTLSMVEAFIDINYEGMIIKDLKIVNGRNGRFVSYPREQGKDNKWYDIIIPDNMNLKLDIEKIIFEAYNKFKEMALPKEAD